MYIIGNGFDIHHEIESTYLDFKKWVRQNKSSDLIGLMDIFFSYGCDFWADIEKALGDYRENAITEYCEPMNPDDYKYEHPGAWQAGVEDSIPYVFGRVMDQFKDTFDEWVQNIDIGGVETDLNIPVGSKYLSFNYTETLEKYYSVPKNNILHIHGNRLVPGEEFILGHNNKRDVDDPFKDETQELPYQNANSAVIDIMNQWIKDPEQIIEKNKAFFKTLGTCKAVCIIGLSYSEIDMPYLKEIKASVAPDSKWWLYFHSAKDKTRAERSARELGLNSFYLKQF